MSKKKEVELKRTSKTFTTSVTDLDRIQEFLEEMALNGWILKSVSSNKYNFEKCEPKKVRYYVDFFNVEGGKKNARYNYNGRKEYIQLCEESGWNYVTNGNGLLFFYTEDMKLAPIKEDDEEKFKGICKYFVLKNGGAPMCVLSVLAIIAFIAICIFNIIDGDMIYSLMCDTDYQEMYWMCYLVFIMFSGSTSIVKFILFYKNNKKQDEDGFKIKYLTKEEDTWIKRISHSINIIWLIFIFLYSFYSNFIFGLIVSILLVVLCICGIYGTLKEKKMFGHIKTQQDFLDNNFRELVRLLIIGIIVVIVICGHRYSKGMLLPKEAELQLTDLGIDKDEYTDYYETDNSRMTIFSDTKSYYLGCDKKGSDDIAFELNYEVMNSQYIKAIEAYKTNKIHNFNGVVSEAKTEDKLKWKAREVYNFDNKNDHGIMVIYEDKIIYIISDYKEKIDFTGKYVDVITEKLNK